MSDLFDPDGGPYANVIPERKSDRTVAEINAAEGQIVSNIKDVRYLVREYPAEVIVQKYMTGRKEGTNEIFVPDYQRELVWPDKKQSRFIESLLIGLPIPFLFVADVSRDEDPDKAGRLEIVDGVQRIRTLARFMTGELVLTDLERLNLLNGFRFHDLHPSRQRRFSRATLRMIELTETVTEDVRREMFDRINTGSVTLEAVEIRRGIEPGPFLDLVNKLAQDELLRRLAPVSPALQRRFEYEELITRFFAFVNRYTRYGIGPEGKVVKDFLLSYVRATNADMKTDSVGQLAVDMTAEWSGVLTFVERHFPNGFRKSGSGRQVPRVRFEAIAVGTALALRERPHLIPANMDWLEGTEFKAWTTSDASNNRANLIGRVEFVRDRLLEK